ncbi:MAG: hypothetical protein IH881_16315 [Myxococcales bacterium]|nr:hypothetical protein [Myxococcales bacterium]
MSIPTKNELRTDVGNAKRFAERYKNRLRYIPQSKCWLEWDGRRWEQDTRNHVVELAKFTTREYYRDACKLNEGDERKAAVKHGLQSEKQAQLFATIKLAQSDPRLAIDASELDSDPWLLNCQNGTVDLRAGELRPPRRNDLITKITPVCFDPTSRSQKWEDFLETATGGDQELRVYLQMIAGYSLTGDTSEEILLLLFGPAASGKTTFLEAIKAAMGDYAATAGFQTFLKQAQPGAARGDLARLVGVRLVTGSEAPAGHQFDDTTLKQLTGGDTITVRKLYGDPFEFKPQFKIVLAGNDRPVVRDGEQALWRRLKAIPFPNAIPANERNPGLKAYLTDPLGGSPAVLAWMVEGALAWQKLGLQEPESVKQATAEYRSEMEIFGQFVEDRLIEEPEQWAETSAIFSAYQLHNLLNENKYPYGQRRVTSILRSRGHKPMRRDGKRGWQGVGLKPVRPVDTSATTDTNFKKSK